MKTGANVFLTGEPGSGKTFAINKYINWLEAAGLNVAVTASTGIAATHIGGMTIHSWSGVGARDTLSKYDLEQIVTKERLIKRIKKTHVLIIDEISMLDGKLFDMVDIICRSIRGSAEPFGGMQVVCVGDFFQLPPVTRNGDMMRYAFNSRAWENLRPLICYLTEQYRQEDELLLSLLKSIRRGEIEEEHYTLLAEQTEIAYAEVEPTRLYTHNVDVDTVNTGKLSELPGYGRTFSMKGKGSKPKLETLTRNCLSPANLILKEEAMVMCTKNNFEAGYVNGTLARVIGFAAEGGFPIIETADKRQITMEPTSWEMVEEGKVLATIEQVPLRLAWAITVHKSQGMSLDAVEVDLSKSFVYGQGYVALSRVRTLAGLKVLGVNPNALMVDPKIIMQDGRFQEESRDAEETFLNLEEGELNQMHERFVKASGGKIPSKEEVEKASLVDVTTKVKKASTYAETRALILQGMSLEEIALAREIAVSTVITHIETLVAENEIDENQLRTLVGGIKGWKKIYTELSKVIDELGPEKLKPIFEATDGKYDYHIIRLARLYSQALLNKK